MTAMPHSLTYGSDSATSVCIQGPHEIQGETDGRGICFGWDVLCPSQATARMDEDSGQTQHYRLYPLQYEARNLAGRGVECHEKGQIHRAGDMLSRN
jgi:hypothetical protein